MSISPSKGSQYHAQVGASVPKDALESVLGKLIVEARKHFHAREFEQALHVFRHALSIAEKTSSKGSHSEYGAIMHNIASCLHCLGEFEDAKTHYLAALAAFQKHPVGRVWAALYGDVDKRRCDFVQERLVDIQFGRKPDLDKYLDGNGLKRDVTEAVIQSTVDESRYGNRRELNTSFPAGLAYGGFGMGVSELGYGASVHSFGGRGI